MSDKHIYTLETLKRMAKDVKSEGKTVGLTHGAFDLFHVSHLDLLKKASKRCDFLIVGVDSDANIAKYKSYKRPIIDEEDRLKIISELNCVDGVFINNTNINNKDYIQLYKELGINNIFTGIDFGFRNELEYRCSKVGANYQRIRTKQTHTTQIIDQILKTYQS
ncbi:adenylyltransferase/cytidyltransferase family protein [Candidatus Dojkabacteria bacterium]|uniref:Adenylyltransferase/cytidyltransferase family protein n=1 Tax=Candidatus Dojkabacteria bacterium TaxID=2099670 RepID=A0A955L451_9BACT|nr:adenylyltransferase/cytidyltransferase family protein [Candidatus Dojkabacteria bacterium]